MVYLMSFQVFAKTYVIPSTQMGCHQVLEITSAGQLSHYQKYLRVSFVGEVFEEKKLFKMLSVNRYYDSVWLDYEAMDGEVLEYFWDDGNGVSEGFRYQGCLYEIK